MKKKRFYNNKKRNEKWTEPPKGRKISFADKYIDTGNGSDKYDNSRKKEKKPVFTKAHFNLFAKNFIIIIACFAIISVGYTVMDLYIDRKAMPLTQESDDSSADLSGVSLQLRSERIEPMAMDGGVMLSAIIDEINDGGYVSAVFDLKRDDGTIGYDSNLATIDMYGAESSPAGDINKSISELLTNDILPIGRISCYKDNVVAVNDSTAGLTVNGSLYKDSDGNAYLNPNSRTAYNYIKGIIEEAKGMGVTVFVLDNCILPDELRDEYNDGFKSLSEKLYNDFGSDIKLLECVSITIDADDDKKLQQEVKEKTEKINGDDIIFNITAKNKNMVKQFLDTQNSINYIISE